MSATLNDTKRLAIAEQLAGMKALQRLLISVDQMLLDALDGALRPRLQKMLEQDQKNLSILETVIVQYGIQAQPKDTIEQQVKTLHSLMESSDLTLAEKVSQHELLKHQQTMTGLVIHKIAQRVGADVEAAITPLHTINFENRAHQEQLKGMIELLGVRELTGQDAEQGLWARVEDAIAALAGIAGSLITRTDDEIPIRELLLMDHSKADVLFTEILGSDDPQKIQEYFGQLYSDVTIHGLAEEQVLYPAVQPHYSQMPEIFDQTDGVIEMLDDIKALNPTDPNFKAQIEQVRIAVRSHVNQEEKDIFPKLKDCFSHEQQKQLATDFKAAKKQLQEQMAANDSKSLKSV
ncbi:hemerythrin domain-containing protein [Pseudanabaena sp. FACHB-2040]|uniref:hemerythrin domain-containing protein n=1 Tax=Pseudanabaena sp. FACHB-2040 TaxID=2692859 RepID=UPI001686A56E|nr:hemerythrin domain-containing protein [Pseudanabaena sp. FACHB-2040]MBD2257076.1 hemerythrin domain-containing protein [Pseudanabaena sp. FACHB-2040]